MFLTKLNTPGSFQTLSRCVFFISAGNLHMSSLKNALDPACCNIKETLSMGVTHCTQLLNQQAARFHSFHQLRLANRNAMEEDVNLGKASILKSDKGPTQCGFLFT